MNVCTYDKVTSTPTPLSDFFQFRNTFRDEKLV